MKKEKDFLIECMTRASNRCQRLNELEAPKELLQNEIKCVIQLSNEILKVIEFDAK